jgi:CMP-N-acetylneuraminic acid synthetase
MKTVCFIPIKLNNERTPGKNLKKFSDGTPLIHLVEKNVLGVKEIDDIYVYCSNDSIEEYILEGIKYLKRPTYLDTSSTRCNDIIKAFVDTIDADIYVMAHATSPFVTSEHIQTCVDAVKSGEYDSAYAAVKMQNFIWYQDKPLNFSISNNLRTQDMEPIWVELSTPFVFTKDAYRVYGGRTGKKPYRCECTSIEGIDIDYPEDFELANLVYGSSLFRGKA